MHNSPFDTAGGPGSREVIGDPAPTQRVTGRQPAQLFVRRQPRRHALQCSQPRSKSSAESRTGALTSPSETSRWRSFIADGFGLSSTT